MTLFGFCLIASLYSPEFLDGVSRQLIRRVNQLDSGLRMEKSERKSELKSVEALVNDVAKDIPVEDRPSAGKTILPDDARQVAASVGAVSDLPGDEGSAGDVRAAIRPLTDAIAGLTSDEARTLQVSMYLTKRTATGIAQDAGIPRSKIGEILDHLAEKGLVQRTVSDRTGGARWAITKQGTALLNSADKA
jgi:predicted transcriptional regulator